MNIFLHGSRFLRLPRPRAFWFVLALALAFTHSSRGAERNDVRPPGDDEVAVAVQRALRYDAAVPSDAISVKTVNGIVTLRGVVDNLLAKERASNVAAQVRGTRSVINLIDVEPPPRTDEAVAADIRSELRFDPATDRYQIEVEVRDGRVTLSGTVDSWQESRLAQHVVKSVPGVKEIVDRILVERARERPDEEIAADVTRMLEMDAWVDAAPIDVGVHDGTVRLAGTVGSVAEKNRAYADAWVAGVKAVNVGALTVEPWARGAARAGNAASRSDEEIARAVRDVLLQDPRLDAFNVEVKVVDGVATLRGAVDNVKARMAAGRDARNTSGVDRVENLLRVRNVTKIADDTVRTQLREALERNLTTEAREIEVKVKGGVAELSGTVASSLEKSEAGDVAQRAVGVVEVRNRLKVSSPEREFFVYDDDPPWDYEPRDRGAMLDPIKARLGLSGTPYANDGAIASDIENEMFWSPFVDGGDIRIEVTRGIATLTGTVHSRRELQAAIENAYEGGALDVINKLRVE